MDYKKKIEYAERIATELQGEKTTEQIKSDLKKDGLYERDITSIIISARNMLGDTYLPKIREYLLDDKDILNAQEFHLLNKEILETLIVKESQNLSLAERKKMTTSIKEGLSVEEVLSQVDTRFLSIDKANQQMESLQEIKDQNSGGGRMLNIIGGGGLIVFTVIIALGSGRVFYVLPIIGIVMLVKGFTTERMSYED